MTPRFGCPRQRRPDGTLLATEDQTLDALPPGGQIAFAGQLDTQEAPATEEVTYKG